MAKQTFTTGAVLTAAQMTSLQQTAMGGGSATTKTASYTLVAADAGTTVTMTSASATTITVNTSLFAAGDTVYIQNLGAGVSTITAGTATVSTSATLALAQYEGGQLYFNSTSAAIFIKGAGAAASSIPANDGATVTTSQTTTSATYTDLTTAGPAVTVTTSTKVLVIISAQLEAYGFESTYMSFAVSGATTSAATDARAIYSIGTSSDEMSLSAAQVITVTAGSNTFTAKYKCTGGGARSFENRHIFVMNLA